MAEFVATGDASIWDEGVDVRYLRPDGSEVPIEIAAWHTGEGDAYRVHAFVWDISERLAEQALLEASEAKWQALVRHSSDMTIVLDAEGRLAQEVPTTRTLLGYRDHENHGRHFADLIHPQDLERVADRFARVLAQPGHQERERVRIRRFDGALGARGGDRHQPGRRAQHPGGGLQPAGHHRAGRRRERAQAPGPTRSPHRPAQPQPDDRGPGQDLHRGPGGPCRTPAHGPRRLQGHQRRPRPRRRGPTAGGDRPPPGPGHPRRRPRRPARWRRVRHPPQPPPRLPPCGRHRREPGGAGPGAHTPRRRDPRGRRQHRHRRLWHRRRSPRRAPAGRRGHVPGQAPAHRTRRLRQRRRRGAAQQRQGRRRAPARPSTGATSSCTTSRRSS